MKLQTTLALALAALSSSRSPAQSIPPDNIWSLGGPPGSSDRTNQLLFNPIVTYHFAEGWSVGSSPNITTNWIANGGKWTVPLGGGFGKAAVLGEQPIKLDLNFYYNAIRPKAANDTWLLQVTLTFQFPK